MYVCHCNLQMKRAQAAWTNAPSGEYMQLIGCCIEIHCLNPLSPPIITSTKILTLAQSSGHKASDKQTCFLCVVETV